MTPENSTHGVRVIKRYANRKLYDTGSGELTSLRRIERLVRSGVDIRVLDHDSGQDLTGEVLVGILGNTVGEQPTDSDIPLLTSLIRAPGELLAAMFHDEQRTEELRAMGERVRLLSTTIDALLAKMEPDEATGDSASQDSAGLAPPRAKASKPGRRSTPQGRAATPVPGRRAATERRQK